MKVVIYVGCSLTHATEEFRREIQAFKARLKTLPNVEVLEFLGLVTGTSQDVYEHDIHRGVKKANFFIAECSHPSIGLGWELGVAVEKQRITVLAVAKKEMKVSRFIEGAVCARNPKFAFERYETADDLFNLALPYIEKLSRVRTRKKAS